MEGKLTGTEKVLEGVALGLLAISIVVRSLLGVSDTGVLVMLAFTGILLYIILLVCAFFPADWRMTDAQREKIKDMDAYQAKYRRILVGVNLAVSVFSALLIIVVK